jgi:hypothetical protein
LRYLVFLIAAMVLTACSTSPVTRNQSQAVRSAQGVISESQKASMDSVVEFLLTSAATDFRTHGPYPILNFRDVRVGHDVTSDGTKLYTLVGQFLAARDGGKAGWTPFATIKTSGYEQYIGGQAVAFYQKSSFVWDEMGDLSSLLQSRLDSLR